MDHLFERLSAVIAEETASMVSLRHTLHRYPELSHKEFETTRRVEAALADIDVRVRHLSVGVGLIVDIGPPDQPKIGIRGDMDALSIEETTGLPFASENKGVMHACGHDVHTASVYGALRALAKIAPEMSFRFFFQHAEEATPGGAIEMLREGALEGVTSVIAMHCDPSRPVGRVAIQSGPLTASNDQFWVELQGDGGHGARPHETQDLILAGAQIIQSIYHAFDRHLDPRHPFVMSLGVIHAGDQSPNVIPTKLRFGGSIRSVYREARERSESILRRTLEGMSQMLSIRYHLEMRRGAPGVHNDPIVTDALKQAASSLLGEESVEPVGLPSMGGEDFAFFTQAIPGAMIRIGTGYSTALHTPTFTASDDAVPLAANLLARAALILSRSTP